MGYLAALSLTLPLYCADAMLKKKGENFNLFQKIQRRLTLIYYTQVNMLTRRDSYDAIPVYCMFIGYPRSGHTLIGASLDAHPNVILGHEMDALKYVIQGDSRDKLYSRLLGMSRTFISIGGRWMDYDYKIPDMYQGRATELKVIGDKKGGGTTNKIRQDPALLDKLSRLVGADKIRMVHVTRNPFDVITTRARGGNLVLEQVGEAELRKGAEAFFQEADTVAMIKDRGFRVIDVSHEAYIADPRAELRKLCEALSIEAPADYLEACASIVFAKPKKSRLGIPWPDALKAEVQERINRYPFLRGYTWDS